MLAALDESHSSTLRAEAAGFVEKRITDRRTREFLVRRMISLELGELASSVIRNGMGFDDVPIFERVIHFVAQMQNVSDRVRKDLERALATLNPSRQERMRRIIQTHDIVGRLCMGDPLHPAQPAQERIGVTLVESFPAWRSFLEQFSLIASAARLELRSNLIDVSSHMPAKALRHAPSPVLGFNNNVRHRGRVFHIRTEDGGVKSARIVTILFADGGRIVKTTRTSYLDQIDRTDLSQVVRQLMKDQHKATFTALRTGELDESLESSCGPFPDPAAVVRTHPTPGSPVPEVRAPPAARGLHAPAGSTRAASGHGLTSAKSVPSILGDSLLAEESLDEVILSYLAETDEDESG